ncbi:MULTISPECIES: type II CAAX endopeptidase family protein [unclassified Methanobrevibacter]|uniref:CPBP family intramembrane glutamic endopeptidase n=1 Tax=unclassified Methanobrevibacter TaxID=2638681 RepID=UPI002733A401|nr:MULTISPECIES: type II CAAX endopeptidase family protein [unclassified Methanobrevibacter]
MSLFNDKLKKITLEEVLSLIVGLYVIHYFIIKFNIVNIDAIWIYVFVIFYFVFKLRNEIPSLGEDISQLFKLNLLKTIFLVVILNIFLSYGMLYLADFILNIFTVNFSMASYSILSSSLLTIVVVAPISEELIFRGVFLNRLKLFIPLMFSVLVSSVFFASLHSFGSIFSAFIFAICVSILYLKTDNIVVPIFAHFLNNLFAEIIIVLDSSNVLFNNTLVIIVMSILAVISFALIVMSIIPELKNINNKDL